MDLSSESSIYTGVWVNWAHGPITGATLTLSPQAAAILTAFIATFITVAGTQLWRIICFLIHRRRCTAEERDGLHHQHQVILRNSSTPDDTIWLHCKQLHRWRGLVQKPTRRTLAYLSLSVSFIAALAAASILGPSAIVTAGGEERLVRSESCGLWDINPEQASRSVVAFEEKVLKDAQAAAAYTRDCYRTERDAFRCGNLQTPHIEWTSTRTVECPFGGSICLRGKTPGYRMDTGRFNSHRTLGINTPLLETVDYRRVTTCASLETAGYSTTSLATRIEEYFYGPRENDMFTFNYDPHATLLPISYEVIPIGARLGIGSSWTPAKELNRTDADVNIIFIAFNGVEFTEPCLDDVFKATEPSNRNITDPYGKERKFYTADNHISVISCADQYQYCNPRNGVCTELTGSGVAFTKAQEANLGLSESQIGILNRIYLAQRFSGISNVLFGRSMFALRAAESLNQLQQAPLPDNQWEIESAYWFETGLASLQQQVHEYAAGPNVLPSPLRVRRPFDQTDEKLCNNQKIRTTNGTVSFSILGLVLTLIIGGLIILTNQILEPIIRWIQSRRGNLGTDHRTLQWALDGKLQLQRALFQERGIATWSHFLHDVPATGGGSKFSNMGSLDDAALRQRVSASSMMRAKVERNEDSKLLNQTARETSA